jgi:hypothetical protein
MAVQVIAFPVAARQNTNDNSTAALTGRPLIAITVGTVPAVINSDLLRPFMDRN